MKKNTLRLFALLLAAIVSLGCLALAEDAPDAAETVETPAEEPAMEEPADPETQAAEEAPAEGEPGSQESTAEEPAEPEEGSAGTDETAPGDPEEPVEAPDPSDPEGIPAEPEEAFDEEELPEEIPTEEGEAADEGEEIAEEGQVDAAPEGLVIENGVVTEYNGNATNLVIPDGVTGIASGVFSHSQTLRSVLIPNSVTSIGASAFAECYNLTNVDIGNSVTEIGSFAFFMCVGLTSVSIPDSVISIDDAAFYGCSELTSICMGNSVSSIGSMAFNGCSQLAIYGYPGSYAEAYASENNIPFETLGGAPDVISASTDESTVPVKQDITFTVKTPFTARYLAMFSENGARVKVWDAAGNSAASGNIRTWTVQYAIAGTGDRRLTFRASADGSAYGAGKTVSITVAVIQPDVISASADVARIPAKEDITFTVVTPNRANYLAMYAESGAKIKTWSKTGNSSESGDTRTWTVRYAIANAGSRKLTVKCAAGTTYGEGKEVSVRVLAARPAVTSASVSPTTIEKGKPASFTVVTPTTAKYVAMYSEGGAKVKSWGYSSYSTVSGSTRTWTIPYTFSGTGNRALTFKCCADGYGFYGEGREVALKVIPPLPAVKSATASPSPVVTKQEVTFTVETPSSANYLAMYAENGGKVKVWGKTGNSTDSDTVRTWTVKYAIAGIGRRVLTFKCSANGTYGEGKTVSLTVTAIPPAVTSATADLTDAHVGQDVTFTVKTPEKAKYLALYAEDEAKLKVWGMTGNSAVSGTTRVWTVKYAIPEEGNRELTFRCSAEGTYGEGKMVNVTAWRIIGLGVTARSQQEIRNFVSAHPAETSSATTFRRAPSVDPYVPGLISEESTQNAINMVNQIRFIAGLNADVKNDPGKEEMMAATAMVNALNGSLSHYPERPSALSESCYDNLYRLGREGASSSNLCAANVNLAGTVLQYMYDSDSTNIDRVGHRRWVLNPSMGKTTFGYYYDSNITWSAYSGMYAFDYSGSGSQAPIAWPAQKMPLSHFKTYYYGDGPSSFAWSVSFGYRLTEDAIHVTMVRKSDGRAWNFSSDQADGDFYVNNTGYGITGCVIFRPSGVGTISAGDAFDVSIANDKDHTILQYSVTFFSL